jgi:hypothetical protein
MTSTSDRGRTPSPPKDADAAKRPPSPTHPGDDDRHKIEKIAKAGRKDFDPNLENDG